MPRLFTPKSALTGTRASLLMSRVDDEQQKLLKKQQEEEEKRKQRELAVRKSEEKLAKAKQQKEFQEAMQSAKPVPGTVKPIKPIISPIDTSPVEVEEDRAVLDVLGGKNAELTPNAQRLVDYDRQYGKIKDQIKELEKRAQKKPAKTGEGTTILGGAEPEPPPEYLQEQRNVLIGNMYEVEKQARELERAMSSDDWDSISRKDELYKRIYEANKKGIEERNERFRRAPGGQALGEALTEPAREGLSLFGVIPGIANRYERYTKGRTAEEQSVIAQARKDATAPETIAGKTSQVLSHLTRYGLEAYATAGVLSRVPGIAPFMNASKAAPIAGGTARLLPTVTQSMARGGLTFGTREAVVQTAEGLGYDRKKIMVEAAAGAVFEGIVAPVLGNVWRRATTTKDGTVFVMRPNAQGGSVQLLPSPAPGGGGGFSIPKSVNEVVMKVAADVKGVQRRMVFNMKDGNIYEMTMMPNGQGDIALQITRNSPNWLKRGAMNLVKKFNGEGGKAPVVDTKAQPAQPDMKALIEKYGSEDAIPLDALSPQGVMDATAEKSLASVARMAGTLDDFINQARKEFPDVSDDILRGIYQRNVPTSLNSVPGMDIPMSSFSPTIVDIPTAPALPQPSSMTTIGTFSIKRFLGGEMYKAYRPYFEVSPEEHRLLRFSTKEPPKTSGGEESVTLYRGENSGNKDGNYFSTDKEFARNFTQSGKDEEIATVQVPLSQIYKAEKLPSAVNEKEMGMAIAEARKKGYKGIFVDEGKGQPNSVFMLEKTVTKSPTQKVQAQSIPQKLKKFKDDPEIEPIRVELEQSHKFLEDTVLGMEEQMRAVNPASGDARKLTSLAEEIRSAVRGSPQLPGGMTREQLFSDLAANGDSITAISKRLTKLAEQTKSATVRGNLERIVKRFGGGTYDDIADFAPFQEAIVSGKQKQQPKDLVMRAESLIKEMGDFEVEPGVTMSNLLDEIDMLEFELNDKIATRLAERPTGKTAKQTAIDFGKSPEKVQGQPKAAQRETRVSGRELLKAIGQVSKSKELGFRLRMREVVAEAKKAQRDQDKMRMDRANSMRESLKSELIQEIRRRVPAERRGKFLSAVKNTRTRNQLGKELARADKEAEAAEKQVVISELKNIANAELNKVDVGYRQEVAKTVEGIDFSKPTEDTLKKLRSRLAFMERTGGFAIPDKLREQVSRLAKEPAAEMSLKDLKDIRDGLRTIIQMGTVARSLKVSRMRSEREKRLAQLLQTTVNLDKQIKDTGKFTPGQLTTQQVKENLRRSNGKIPLFTTKVRMFDQADGDMNYKGENVRLWKENTHDPVQRAARQANEDTANWMRRVIEEVGNYPQLLTPQQQEKYARALAFDQKLKTQMEASGWKYERPDLTESEDKIVKILQEEADKFYSELAALHALENNEYLPKVKNYFPTKYEREVLQDEEKFDDPRKLLFAETKMDAAASLRSVEGMLQMRSPGVQRKLRTDVFNVLNEHIASRAWLINVEPELRNVHAIINSPEYREKAGTMMVEYWNRYIKNVMAEHKSFARRYSPETLMEGRLSTNLGVAYLAMRLSTTVVQLDQIVSGMSYVLAKYGHAAAAKFMLSTVTNWLKPDLVKRTAEETPVIEFRESGDPITAQIMRRLGVTNASKMSKEMEAFEDVLREAYDERNAFTRAFIKFRRKGAKFGMDKFIKFTDVRSASAQYESFKDLFLSLGASPEEALSDAEIATMITNGDSSVTFRPEVFDRIKNLDPAMRELSRSALLFQSFSMNKLMEAWHDIIKNKIVKRSPTYLPRGGEAPPVKPKSKLPGASSEGGEEFMPPKQGGGAFSMYYGFAALALMVAGGYTFEELRNSVRNFHRSTFPKMIGGKGKAPIESDPFLMYALMFLPNQIPLVNSATQIVKNYATGKSYLDSTLAGATFGFVENAMKSVGNMIKKPSMKDALDIMQAVMTAYGVPGTSTMFEILEPIAAPDKPKKSSSSTKRQPTMNRSGSASRRAKDRSAIFSR